MKTIVGWTDSFRAGALEQAAANKAQASHGETKRRTGKLIDSPPDLCEFFASQCMPSG